MEVFQISNDDDQIQSKTNWADCEFNENDIDDKPERDGFDLRHKLSQKSPCGEEIGKESSSQRQQLREHDLRLKLSRNRQEQMEHSSKDGRRRYEGPERGRRRRGEPGRARYTERVAGLSPLRSPRATTLRNILDLDNSRNYRFTDHLQDGNGSSPNNAIQRRIRRSNQRTPHDDEKYPGRTTTVLSDCEDSEEINSWTPDYSRKTCRLDKTSWTRRRLELPAESTERDSDEESRLPTISEENRVRMARREKDIAYGKNTDAYRMYIELIPRELRSQNGKKHPRTPKKDKECSRRSWDAQVKLWKRRLHAWANEEATNQESTRSGNDSPQEGNSWASIVAHGSFSEGKHETKEHSNDGAMKGSCHDNGDVEGDDEDDFEEAGGEKEESEDEEADAFLDSADIDFSVAHQVQEQVRLDDA
ncbi:hypothetical protein RRG08_054941 [Elysia crispata]|uniref:Histone RNA hairpin-binding protein RNA-binding domain-containing protein n=1 Tax=Elysia crispata TaxID=231223 RepID=A0AAE0YZ80_9GAST|nr:hypothetical protein RRG08_054941 [Elysia crispata]